MRTLRSTWSKLTQIRAWRLIATSCRRLSQMWWIVGFVSPSTRFIHHQTSKSEWTRKYRFCNGSSRSMRTSTHLISKPSRRRSWLLDKEMRARVSPRQRTTRPASRKNWYKSAKMRVNSTDTVVKWCLRQIKQQIWMNLMANYIL